MVTVVTCGSKAHTYHRISRLDYYGRTASDPKIASPAVLLPVYARLDDVMRAYRISCGSYSIFNADRNSASALPRAVLQAHAARRSKPDDAAAVLLLLTV